MSVVFAIARAPECLTGFDMYVSVAVAGCVFDRGMKYIRIRVVSPAPW